MNQKLKLKFPLTASRSVQRYLLYKMNLPQAYFEQSDAIRAYYELIIINRPRNGETRRKLESSTEDMTHRE